MKKYEFSDNRYIAAHGKAPRGRGWWAFIAGGKTYLVEQYVTLTEAKKAVTAMLREDNFCGYTVYIAP